MQHNTGMTIRTWYKWYEHSCKSRRSRAMPTSKDFKSPSDYRRDKDPWLDNFCQVIEETAYVTPCSRLSLTNFKAKDRQQNRYPQASNRTVICFTTSCKHSEIQLDDWTKRCFMCNAHQVKAPPRIVPPPHRPSHDADAVSWCWMLLMYLAIKTTLCISCSEPCIHQEMLSVVSSLFLLMFQLDWGNSKLFCRTYSWIKHT